ncbi:MAG: hypothetical protein C0602_11215 [Denitrovibrio sp.]|nr:MAG: hypothetical protein C0602_11215 [Denitrovibrio sp.]
MKKLIILLVVIVAAAGVVGVSAFSSKDAEGTVGYLDGQAVMVSDLQNYVDSLLGEAYEDKLKSKEGRKELFGHYVNRTILLKFAKENIKENDSFVASHTMGNVSTESAILSAVLKKEVNDKVKYTEEEVRALLESNKELKDLQAAERELISRKRIELFRSFISELKSNHNIELADS